MNPPGLDEFVYRLAYRVAFADLDFYRHVNNAVHLRWTETARIDYFDRFVGVPLGASPHVIMASQTFHYREQLGYGDELVLTTRCSRLGTRSLEMTNAVFRDGACAGWGTTALVAYDFAAAASLRVPDAWRERIRAFERRQPEERA